MSFQEKCFSSYILLTDQMSLFDCLYFLRYRVICVLQLFVNQVVTSKNFNQVILIHQDFDKIFLIKSFWYVTKRSWQKLKYFENEKSFWGKIKHLWQFLKGFQLPKIVWPDSMPLIIQVLFYCNIIPSFSFWNNYKINLFFSWF